MIFKRLDKKESNNNNNNFMLDGAFCAGQHSNLSPRVGMNALAFIGGDNPPLSLVSVTT